MVLTKQDILDYVQKYNTKRQLMQKYNYYPDTNVKQLDTEYKNFVNGIIRNHNHLIDDELEKILTMRGKGQTAKQQKINDYLNHTFAQANGLNRNNKYMNGGSAGAEMLNAKQNLEIKKIVDETQKYKLLYQILHSQGDIQGYEYVHNLIKQNEKILKNFMTNSKDPGPEPEPEPEPTSFGAGKNMLEDAARNKADRLKYTKEITNLRQAQMKESKNWRPESMVILQHYQDLIDQLEQHLKTIGGSKKCKCQGSGLEEFMNKGLNKVGLQVPPIFGLIYDVAKDYFTEQFKKKKGGGPKLRIDTSEGMKKYVLQKLKHDKKNNKEAFKQLSAKDEKTIVNKAFQDAKKQTE
jgi:hypothetical protein